MASFPINSLLKLYFDNISFAGNMSNHNWLKMQREMKFYHILLLKILLRNRLQ